MNHSDRDNAVGFVPVDSEKSQIRCELFLLVEVGLFVGVEGVLSVASPQADRRVVGAVQDVGEQPGVVFHKTIGKLFVFSGGSPLELWDFGNRR